MKIIRTIAEMQGQALAWRRDGLSIGFVPTMGYLHEGHLSLVRIAVDRTDRTVVSIFVNPTQFGPAEDLSEYPRDFARDEALCRAGQVAAIFYPDTEEMYPADGSTWVTEESLSKPLCGRSRPMHFRGVTTVVAKLLNAVQPTLAVFGEKDAQQALVIQRMVRDLNFPVAIVVGPVVRETDGLALSSRNRYLTRDERERALSIYRGLRQAEECFHNGERDADRLRKAVRDEIEAAAGQVDYVELVSRANLTPIAEVQEPAVLAVAAFFGRTRLIDNCFLG